VRQGRRNEGRVAKEKNAERRSFEKGKEKKGGFRG